MVDVKWLEDKKHYWWWVPDVSKLDDEAVVEGILNYGRWREFKELKSMLGMKRLEEIFHYMTKVKTRVNLRPEKIALYNHYIKNHVAH